MYKNQNLHKQQHSHHHCVKLRSGREYDTPAELAHRRSLYRIRHCLDRFEPKFHHVGSDSIGGLKIVFNVYQE